MAGGGRAGRAARAPAPRIGDRRRCLRLDPGDDHAGGPRAARRARPARLWRHRAVAGAGGDPPYAGLGGGLLGHERPRPRGGGRALDGRGGRHRAGAGAAGRRARAGARGHLRGDGRDPPLHPLRYALSRMPGAASAIAGIASGAPGARRALAAIYGDPSRIDAETVAAFRAAAARQARGPAMPAFLRAEMGPARFATNYAPRLPEIAAPITFVHGTPRPDRARRRDPGGRERLRRRPAVDRCRALAQPRDARRGGARHRRPPARRGRLTGPPPACHADPQARHGTPMKVIICGAGQVGWQIARHLSTERNDVTVVDYNPDLVRRATDTLDVQGIAGHRLLSGRARPRGRGRCRHDHRRDPFRRGEHGHLPGRAFPSSRSPPRSPACARSPTANAIYSDPLPPRPHAHRRRHLGRKRRWRTPPSGACGRRPPSTRRASSTARPASWA